MKLTTLPNGLRVASRSIPGFETVAIGLYVDAGSRHETAELNGIAHLFEHMVFKGAGGRSAREISEAVEDVGGDLNACTDRDGTSFAATMLAEHMELGVELLSDLVLRPHFDAQELEREKQVVLQELAEARDTPSDIIFDELWSAAFAQQPLGRSILGTEPTVGRVSVADLFEWRDTHYRAGSLYLVAAGKVDHDVFVACGEQRFGQSASGTSGEHDRAHFTSERRVLRSRSDQAHLTFAFQGPATCDPEVHAARLFADVVGGGASSRLFQTLREDRGLAYSVSASLQPYADVGILSVHAATSAAEAKSAAQLIEDVLQQAASDISEKELNRARTQARASLLMSLESSWGQANYIARQLAVHGRLVEPDELIAALNKVTVNDIRAAGKTMLYGPKASASIGAPVVRAA